MSVAPAMPRIARAQAYPSKPVRIVTGFSSGSAMDTIARLIAQWLTERVGQFVVENRGGRNRKHQGRQAARTRGDLGDAVRRIAGPSNRRRLPAGL
jgi:tripartite-type tricarboxylate transporter receptor subunit TctC